MTNNLISIRFTKPHPPYLAGERAGFSTAIAQQLVQIMHVAEYVDPPPGLTPKAKVVDPDEAAKLAEKKREAAIKAAECDEKKKATAEKRRLAAAARRAKKKSEKAAKKK